MFLFLSALLIAADQLSKYWAKTAFPPGSGEQPLGLGFSLTYVENSGAAFGIFRDMALPLGPITINSTLLLGLLSAAVALGLLVFLLRAGRRLEPLQLVALTLIFSGAVGNMIDRLTLAYVVDFIHFQVGNFNFPVFNIADACVVVGAGLLLLGGFLPEQPQPERQRARHLSEPEFFQVFEHER